MTSILNAVQWLNARLGNEPKRGDEDLKIFLRRLQDEYANLTYYHGRVADQQQQDVLRIRIEELRRVISMGLESCRSRGILKPANEAVRP